MRDNYNNLGMLTNSDIKLSLNVISTSIQNDLNYVEVVLLKSEFSYQDSYIDLAFEDTIEKQQKFCSCFYGTQWKLCLDGTEQLIKLKTAFTIHILDQDCSRFIFEYEELN